jgi:S-adenosylmethionine decarboxylase
LKNPFPLNHPIIQDSPVRDPDKIPAIPGLHIVANFNTPAFKKISAFEHFRFFIDHEIQNFNLTKVGEIYHNFPGGVFTGVVCLTESHLSIHTWP